MIMAIAIIISSHLKNTSGVTSLAVQWLRLLASDAGGMGLIPGQGTKIHMPRGEAKTKQNKTKNTIKLLISLQLKEIN